MNNCQTPCDIFDCVNSYKSRSPSPQIKREDDSKSGDASNVSVGTMYLLLVYPCKLGNLLMFL